MNEIAPRRTYTSPLREAAAQRTRDAIVAAAAALFAGKGYAGTTIAEIAREAGVAVRTVHTACPGGKFGLFREALDAASSLPPVRDPAAEGDVVERVVGYSVDVLERTGPLLSAAIEASGADPVMREFAEETIRDTRENAATIAEGLAASNLLRAEVSVDRAADVLFAVVSPQMHDMLRRRCAWSVTDYREFVVRTLRSAVLHP
ncbi:TetR family transcriptional regulator [Rhodococcus rhodnii]|uniref:TetR family transcriptional regulator n=2 Tax=Rhodococcus rhodnii TaxID=38312 RepID=R7WTM1_9NOCA|nr:TetR family transcriptional regulator [Rhodococcus rhodnii]EOM78602.1 TetR family transcriptional regulator [Rhodococcus rhodnii LMG 5362]TXG91382.1 TetR family transcriptional regulator [Rhodococcus rhodnii]